MISEETKSVLPGFDLYSTIEPLRNLSFFWLNLVLLISVNLFLESLMKVYERVWAKMLHKWCCKMPCLFPGMSLGIMQISEAFWENKNWELDFILEVSVLNFFSTFLLASSRYHFETKMRLHLFTWQKICNTNNTLKIPNDYENLACSN